MMVGFGEGYFAPLALFLDATPFQVGLLATLPMLLGSLFQIPATRIAHHIGEKHWVVASAVVQSVVLFVTAWLAWTQWHGYETLLVLVCVYWIFNLGLGPAWNVWMGRMIPQVLRGRFFARRTSPIQLSLCLAIIGAGIVLQTSKSLPAGPALGFLICYLVAGLARAGSAHFLSIQHDPGKGLERTRPSMREAFSGFNKHPYGRLILLIVCISGAVNLSAPYFTPYWLKAMQLNYAQYTTLTAISFVARVFAAPYWGEVARNFGNRRAFQVAMTLIIPLSAMWNVSGNFAYMVFVQILAGFAWAGFDLCYVLLLYDCTDEKNRSQVLALFGLLNGTMIVVGSLLGGLLLRWAGDPGYHYLFALSAVGRLASVLLFASGVGIRQRGESAFSTVLARVLTLRRA